ncbi:MAG: ABC transporter substrate-binding protein [Thermofilum sp.]|nr:ABC transporter substrate-binding protein [Thermofilum sp.]
MTDSYSKNKILVAVALSLLLVSTTFVVPRTVSAQREEVVIPKGGTLRVGLIATGPLIYVEGPITAAAGPAILVENVLRLTRETGARQAPNGTWIPLLFSSWQVSPDGLTYTFTIRENAKWSDGTDVTTDDVIFTYEVMKACPELDEWGIIPVINRIEAIDKKHFKVHLKEVFTPFLEYWLAITPLPKHFWKTVDGFLSADYTKLNETVSTGPFKIVGFSPGTTVIRMVQNPYYWGKKPYIEEIVITLLSPDANIPALMASKAFDIIEVPSPAHVAGLVNLPNITIRTFSTHPYGAWQMARWAGILINNLKYPLSEKVFRQALAYSLDRQQIVDLAAGGYGLVASYGFLPSDFTEWLAPGLPTYPRNLTKAKKLIASLGFVLGPDGFWCYPNGTKLTLELMARPGGETLIATIVAQQWKEVGLDVSVKTYTSAVYVSKYSYGHYDMGVILTNHPLSMDFMLHKFYYPVVTPIGEKIYYRGWTRWYNERYKELMELSRRETNRTKLREIYYEAQRIIADELPFLSLYYAKHIWAYRTDTIEGLEPLEKGFNWPMSELVTNLHLPAVKVTPPPRPPIELYAAGVILAAALVAALYYALRRAKIVVKK